MRIGQRESVSQSPSQRASHKAIITKTYPSAEGGNYIVDAQLLDGSATKLEQIEVGGSSRGEVRGVRTGDFVTIKNFAGEDRAAIIETVSRRSGEPVPESKEGDWTNQFGNSRVEIAGNKIHLGATGGRGNPSSGLVFDMDQGNFYFADGSKKGLYSDGKGNFTWNFNTMSMPSTGMGGSRAGGGNAVPTGAGVSSEPLLSENPLIGETFNGPGAEPETLHNPGTIRLGDGDVFANKLITGSDAEIRPHGNGWVVKNVGVADRTNDSCLHPIVTDSGGAGLVENCYFAGTNTADTAITFVNKDHAGLLTFKDCTFTKAEQSHGIYGADPGAPPSYLEGAQNGVIQVESCYAFECEDIGFRLGTEGSYVKDSVVDSNNAGDLGFWQQWQSSDYINCRVGQIGNVFLRVGPNEDPGGTVPPVSANLENCVFDGFGDKVELRNTADTSWNESGLTINQGVNLSPPDSVPRSAEEASGIQ